MFAAVLWLRAGPQSGFKRKGGKNIFKREIIFLNMYSKQTFWERNAIRGAQKRSNCPRMTPCLRACMPVFWENPSSKR